MMMKVEEVTPSLSVCVLSKGGLLEPLEEVLEPGVGKKQLLEEGKYRVTTIDLTGFGIDLFDADNIKSLSKYVTSLTDFLEKLAYGVKVIMAGHDFGGACISYAIELFPFKIAKAVFVATSMLKSGQSTLDMFSQKDVALATVSVRSIPFPPVLESCLL
ncbi:hypothetical protein M8C21_029556 [Ambrosia artemisiifolia]|uniref:AB hydrolase-1 domain-containing protein n=1 Tax=Ambrosia artemisiifolia TaxID=4212 RepID=A0AAD5CTU0_AMBAR|nr:hypothetical protein M8C21_029556 [Ambrosia artemisiifolia]